MLTAPWTERQDRAGRAGRSADTYTATLGHHEETHCDGNSIGTFGSDDLVVIVREAGRAMARISAESTQIPDSDLPRALQEEPRPCAIPAAGNLTAG
jgi:hypothetical protein